MAVSRYIIISFQLNNSKITTLKGIGEKTGKLFESLGVETIDDLIGFYPVRFIPYENVVSIEEVKDGENVAVGATLSSSPHTIRAGKLKITEATIEDYSGKLRCVWYNSPFIGQSLSRDEDYVFVGKIVNKKNHTALEHPIVYKKDEYEKLAGKLKPIYHLTKGLSQKTVSKAVSTALVNYEFEPDNMPAEIKERYGLIDFDRAVREMHLAENMKDVLEARRRIVFEEFFEFLYSIRRLKNDTGESKSAWIVDYGNTYDDIVAALPFELTEDQAKAAKDMLADMASGRIMNRLIQGDVGSGKTIVALIALAAVVQNGYQGVLMAPTEVLARQHVQTFERFFEMTDIKPRICMLTGSMSAKEKRYAYESISSGNADIIIGTHALIQDGVEFRNLALVITDEQHRFGVRQREALSSKGKSPHIAVMSATPIPRTLAVILYGDLDISNIYSKPAGRIPVKNAVIGAKDRGKAYRTILNEIESGHQAYIICPMVEETETTDAENVIDYSGKIKAILPQNIVVQFLHGRMIQSEKDRIMSEFVNGEIDILVSTTVIEVGVDVPNATVMMIENAERFGLAALHQLRGRVGRGEDQSYCIFVRTSDNETAKKRLEVVGGSNDGFYIAQEDLKLRGPGEILGQAQSGQMRFGVGDIYGDSDILREAYECCEFLNSPSNTEKYKGYLDELWAKTKTALELMMI